MLRQFPIVGFIILAIAAFATASVIVYAWLDWNALSALLVLLAAIGVIVLVGRWRRPPTASSKTQQSSPARRDSRFG